MSSGSSTLRYLRPATCVSVAFLTKLAKHLVVLAGFAIVGHATGRFEASELSIFLMVASAALFHSAGRMLQRRYPRRPPPLRAGS